MHTKTRKIAMTGMLCALTYVVMAVGLLLAAAFVAASCVLFILSWNGIL